MKLFFDRLEWLLKWQGLHTICFAIAAKNIIEAIGLGFGTWLAATLVYIGMSVKIDHLYAMRTQTPPEVSP